MCAVSLKNYAATAASLPYARLLSSGSPVKRKLNSQEEGTPAAMMDGQIPEEIKEERYHQLMAIQAKVSEIRNQELEGSVHTMLVEKVEQEKGVTQAVGRIEIQAPDVDGLTYLEDAEGVQPGDMIQVRIAQGFAYDLVAERLD